MFLFIVTNILLGGTPMKKIVTSMLKALRKATPVYLALLVLCGVLANAGITLPNALQWAYEPVEKTTAYAAAVADSLETAQTPSKNPIPESLVVEAGIFQNTYVTNTGEEITYVIRTPMHTTPNMPLVVYLHEQDIASIPALAQVGVVQAAENLNVNDCIIVQPLCNASWSLEKQEAIVRELTQHIVAKFYCDETRVVLTGFGTGAESVWCYAASHPEYWQKVSPISAAPTTDMESLMECNTQYYLVYGEYDVYSIKSAMNRIGTALMESGSTVLHVTLEGADYAAVRINAYDNNWFAWACQ